MKINETALQQILQAYTPKAKGDTKAQRGDAAEPPVSSGDQISLSNAGQELQRMIRAAQSANDVRGERVDQIRTQLTSGSYVLNPQQIANRMLGLGGGE